MSSNAPYQIRTTYLDGSVTTDIIDNFNNNPKLTLDMYVLSAPDTYDTTASIEILNLEGESLEVFNFIQDEERRAA